MKKIIFYIACVLLVSCAKTSNSDLDVAESAAADQAAQEQRQIDMKLLELQSDNKALVNENADLKKKVDNLSSSMETTDKENEKRLQAMEDLISLMEQTIRGMEEKNSRENFSGSQSVQPLASTNNQKIVPIVEGNGDSSGLEPLSNFPPVSPQPQSSNLDSSSFAKGDEPFDGGIAAPANINPNELAEPSLFPNLTNNPKAKDYYNEAYASYTAKNYALAIDQFTEIVRLFPSDQYTDNSVFWTGMSHFNLNNYQKAEEYFRRVVNDYKHGETSMGFKTPDSIYMLGRVREVQENWSEARYYYETVIERYPNSGSADSSRNKLKILVFKTS